MAVLEAYVMDGAIAAVQGRYRRPWWWDGASVVDLDRVLGSADCVVAWWVG